MTFDLHHGSEILAHHVSVLAAQLIMENVVSLLVVRRPCAQTILLIYFVDTMDGYPRTMDSVILVLNINQLNAIQYDPRFNTSSVGSVQVHSTSRHGMDVVYSWVQWLGVISIAMAVDTVNTNQVGQGCNVVLKQRHTVRLILVHIVM